MAIKNFRYGFVARTIGEWNDYADEIKAASDNHHPWVPGLGEYIFIKEGNNVNKYCIGDGTTPWSGLKQFNISYVTDPSTIGDRLDTIQGTGEGSIAKAIDDVKNEILGANIKDTFDTLVEIQEWIEGPGVNAAELTGAISEEATTRASADSDLGDRLDIIEGEGEGSINKAVTPKADKTYVDTELAKKLDKITYEGYIDGKSMSDAELKTYAENQASAAKSGAEATAASALSAARTAITTEIGQAVTPLATKTELGDVDAKFAGYTKTVDLPTDLDEFTNNAGYAKTADVVTNDEFTAFEVTNTQAIAAAQKTADDVTARVETTQKELGYDISRQLTIEPESFINSFTIEDINMGVMDLEFAFTSQLENDMEIFVNNQEALPLTFEEDRNYTIFYIEHYEYKNDVTFHFKETEETYTTNTYNFLPNPNDTVYFRTSYDDNSGEVVWMFLVPSITIGETTYLADHTYNCVQINSIKVESPKLTFQYTNSIKADLTYHYQQALRETVYNLELQLMALQERVNELEAKHQ